MSNENIDQPAPPAPSVATGPEESTDAHIQVEPVPPAQPETPGPARVLPGEILARLESLELELRGQTGRFQAGLNTLSEKVAFIPPQIRNLGAKIDAVATVAADSKYRSLLLTLLGLHDLVGQMRLGASDGEREGAAGRSLDVIFTQIQQILEGNGLKDIAASETFDPAMHCAIQVVPTEDAAMDGKIARLIRPGFTLAGRLVRFAEVEIWKLRAPPAPPAPLPDAGAGLGAAPEAAPPAPELSERLTI
jgi:molecular chaperone GrpE